MDAIVLSRLFVNDLYVMVILVKKNKDEGELASDLHAGCIKANHSLDNSGTYFS